MLQPLARCFPPRRSSSSKRAAAGWPRPARGPALRRRPAVRHARDFVEASGEFDLMPTLIMVAEQPAGDALAGRHCDLTCGWCATELRIADRQSRKHDKPRAARPRNDAPLRARKPGALRRAVPPAPAARADRSLRRARRPAQRHAQVDHGSAAPSVLPERRPHAHRQRKPACCELLTTILASRTPQVVRNVVSKRTDGRSSTPCWRCRIDPENGPLRQEPRPHQVVRLLRGVRERCASQHRPRAASRRHAAAGRLRRLGRQKLDLAETLLTARLARRPPRRVHRPAADRAASGRTNWCCSH